MSIQDDIKKLRDLLDAGVLTQEEFDVERRALAERALGHSLASGGAEAAAEPVATEPVASAAEPAATAQVSASHAGPRTYPKRRYEKGKTSFSVRTSKLGADIAEISGLPEDACSIGARVLNDFITDRVNSLGRMQLRRIGSFKMVKRYAREGRNPQTGQAITIPARTLLTFKASNVLTAWIEGDGDWPHALSAEEPSRLGHWGPSAKGYLGDQPASKSAKGLSIRRHMAWAVSVGTEMPLSWAVGVVRGWELALVYRLRNEGRLRAHGLGTFKTHQSSPYQGCNPMTGAPIEVPGRLRVKFKADAVKGHRAEGSADAPTPSASTASESPVPSSDEIAANLAGSGMVMNAELQALGEYIMGYPSKEEAQDKLKENTLKFMIQLCKMCKEGAFNKAVKFSAMGEKDTSFFRRSQVAKLSTALKPAFEAAQSPMTQEGFQDFCALADRGLAAERAQGLSGGDELAVVLCIEAVKGLIHPSGLHGGW